MDKINTVLFTKIFHDFYWLSDNPDTGKTMFRPFSDYEMKPSHCQCKNEVRNPCSLAARLSVVPGA